MLDPVSTFAAIVLAGGTSRRSGVADKCSQLIGNRTLLDRALDSVVGADRICVVGPQRATEVDVVWIREEPLSGGPAAGLRAGLDKLRTSADLIATVAGDLPFAGSAVERLLACMEKSTADVAIAVDPDGRDQYLLAAWRRSSLERSLPGNGVSGVSMRALITSALVERVAVTRLESLDVDSPEDFAAAQSLVSATGE